MDPWSRPSAVVAEHAAVSCDQPLATAIGIDVLKMGGNAADAAVAAMAAVSVIQPLTCGIGGDCQSLFYRNSDRKIFAINGSGRTGKDATLQKLQSVGITETIQKEFYNHGLWVSVPGTVAGMCSLIKKFGSKKLTMGQILGPAIELAEGGVPLPYKTSCMWQKYKFKFENSKQAADILSKSNLPLPGEKIYAQKLAQSFKVIASEGANGFYSGKIAENIVKEVQLAGGVLTMEDMKDHLIYKSVHEVSDAVFIDFDGFKIWEMKPNTIGLVALVALNILKWYDLKSLGHNSADYIHIVASAITCAYLKCWDYFCDPDCSPDNSFKSLLCDDIGMKLKVQIDKKKAISSQSVAAGCDTSYVAVVDPEGNGCSFICSVSSDFGSGIIPEDCGFVLHDRLKCMSLDENSSNAYGANKLPLHTIIPSMITDVETGELLAVFGLCGRWMQPQGHIQILLNMIIFGMDPQMALNQPRFYVGNHKTLETYKETLSMLTLEDGIPVSVVPNLEEKSYEVKHSVKGCSNVVFGKGNIIARPMIWNKNATNSQKSWWAAADLRTDGNALGF